MMIKRAAAVTALAVLPLVVVSSVSSALPAGSPADAGSRSVLMPAQLPLAVSVELSSQGAVHAQTILSRLNEMRTERGLEPVDRFAELDLVAQDRTEQMASAGALSEEGGQDGTGDLSGRYPSGWTSVSTVVARVDGPDTSAEVGDQLFEQWAGSTQQSQYMTDPGLNAIGIGLAYDSVSQSWYASQELLSYPDSALEEMTPVGQSPQDQDAATPGEGTDGDAGGEDGGAGDDSGDHPGDGGDSNGSSPGDGDDGGGTGTPSDDGSPSDPSEADPEPSEDDDPENPQPSEDPEDSVSPTEPSESTEETEDPEEQASSSAPSHEESSEEPTTEAGHSGSGRPSASSSAGAWATSTGSGSSGEAGGYGDGAQDDPSSASGTVVAQSEDTQIDEGLAITGASVAAALISQALVVVGLIALMRRRREA